MMFQVVLPSALQPRMISLQRMSGTFEMHLSVLTIQTYKRASMRQLSRR